MVELPDGADEKLAIIASAIRRLNRPAAFRIGGLGDAFFKFNMTI